MDENELGVMYLVPLKLDIQQDETPVTTDRHWRGTTDMNVAHMLTAAATGGRYRSYLGAGSMLAISDLERTEDSAREWVERLVRYTTPANNLHQNILLRNHQGGFIVSAAIGSFFGR